MGSIQTTTSRPRRVSQRPWIDKSLERRASIKMSRRLHAAFSTTSIFRKLPPRVLKWPANKTHRSEEHTSELQSLMRISYAVFCLKKKKKTKNQILHRRAIA